MMREGFKILLFLPVLLFMSHCNEEMVSTVEFPDNKFLMAVIDQGVDKNGDGEISHFEAQLVTSLVVRDYGITDLRGIEAFVNLDSFDCSYNLLTRINDLHGIKGLTSLNCSYNQIASIDLSHNSALRSLSCSMNLLTSLDCSDNPLLERLVCCFNRLEELNVSKNSLLTYLDCGCHSNKLTSLDLSNNPLLEILVAHGIKELSYLDVTKNIRLKALYAGGGNGPSQLTSLDVSKNSDLEVLSIADTNLSELDITNNPSLTNINLRNIPGLNKVCVWQMPFPPIGVSVNTNDSPNVYFTTDCN